MIHLRPTPYAVSYILLDIVFLISSAIGGSKQCIHRYFQCGSIGGEARYCDVTRDVRSCHANGNTYVCWITCQENIKNIKFPFMAFFKEILQWIYDISESIIHILKIVNVITSTILWYRNAHLYSCSTWPAYGFETILVKVILRYFATLREELSYTSPFYVSVRMW